MLASLDVSYADTTATDLRFALGLQPMPALAELDIPEPLGEGSHLSLRVLGTSHQVVLSHRDGECSEVVACLDGVQGDPLDEEAAAHVGPLEYRMWARVSTLPPQVMHDRVSELRHRLAGDRAGLLGAFPGHDDAVTALLAETVGDGVCWRTWHTYPTTGEIVQTSTKVWWAR